MRWLGGIPNSMDMSLSKLWQIVKDREAWHSTVYGVTKVRHNLSDRTTTKQKHRHIIKDMANIYDFPYAFQE